MGSFIKENYPFVIIVSIFVGLIIAMVVMLFVAPDVSEKDFCSTYRYSKTADVPAHCLKYFQE